MANSMPRPLPDKKPLNIHQGLADWHEKCASDLATIMEALDGADEDEPPLAYCHGNGYIG